MLFQEPHIQTIRRLPWGGGPDQLMRRKDRNV